MKQTDFGVEREENFNCVSGGQVICPHCGEKMWLEVGYRIDEKIPTFIRTKDGKTEEVEIKRRVGPATNPKQKE